jgi:hypothetical protein
MECIKIPVRKIIQINPSDKELYMVIQAPVKAGLFLSGVFVIYTIGAKTV